MNDPRSSGDQRGQIFPSMSLDENDRKKPRQGKTKRIEEKRDRGSVIGTPIKHRLRVSDSRSRADTRAQSRGRERLRSRLRSARLGQRRVAFFRDLRVRFTRNVI